MKSMITALNLLTAFQGVRALTLRQTSQGAATIDLSKTTGQATFKGSGWIYGFPDNGIEADTSIPENFIRDVKFNAGRAGGAQTPSSGWVGGYDSYLPRLESTVSNYRTTRKYGGDFILLVHDLWGADMSEITLWPGDDGNWTETDTFLNQIVSDIHEYNMFDGLIIDIWNEPDLDLFWDRPFTQYLEYYVHAHNLLRKELPGSIITGPSMAAAPKLDNSNWQAWFSAIASNGSIPDIWSWHQIGGGNREPDTTFPDFNTLKAAHNLPELPIDLNEYASKEEQNPGTSAWYISQLERHNLRGLRAHWGSNERLHDDLANLIFQKDGTYVPNGEWHVYKYYAAMDGERVATTASEDLRFDVFATKSGSTVKILAGTRNNQAPYEIKVTGLEGIGLSGSGSTDAKAYQFDWAGDVGEIGPPKDLGTIKVDYNNGEATIQFNPETSSTAYAFEITGNQ